MSSQRRVSTKLHNELQSYSSLLRALRVQDIMDVTKQIKQNNPFALTPMDKRDSEELDGMDDEETLFDSPRRIPMSPSSDLPMGFDEPGPSSSPAVTKKSAKAKGKETEKEKPIDTAQGRRLRDQWTRWPLPLNDVLKPEWTLDDEVAFIVSQLLKARPPRPPFPVPEAQPEDPPETGDLQAFAPRNLEFDPEDPDHPFYVPYITSVVAEYLSWLLALLAAHVPARAASMQNRIEPLNWRAVIDVVVSCGVPEFSNTEIVSNVIERMQAIYGPSILPIEGRKATPYRAVERMKDKVRGQEDFTNALEEEVAKYWKFDLREEPEPKSKKRQPRAPRIQRDDEREFKPRQKPSTSTTKTELKVKEAAKVASKRKKIAAKAPPKPVENYDEDEEIPVLPSPSQTLPTPPMTQSDAPSASPQPDTTAETSVRRSARPRRSGLSYELKSFLPPID